jgi:16S rRNA (guanine1207-N2)-methyltransferase
VTFHARVGEETSRVFLSRPGTFAYGKLDDGSRALVSVMEVKPGERVLDLGCGCGTNGVFAGLRAGPGGHVAFADSNVRARALAEHNARANGLTSFEVVASGRVQGPAKHTFDVALANPPYLDRGSVAGLFLVRAHALLKRGGRLYLVTRQPQQVAPMVLDVFGDAEAQTRGGYTIFHATRGR